MQSGDQANAHTFSPLLCQWRSNLPLDTSQTEIHPFGIRCGRVPMLILPAAATVLKSGATARPSTPPLLSSSTANSLPLDTSQSRMGQ